MTGWKLLHPAPAAEQPLLELLNSTPVADGVPLDLLADDADLRRWAAAWGGTGTAAEARELRAARALLQDVVRGERSPAALAVPLAGARAVPRGTADGVEWALQIAPSRRLAAELVLEWARLHDASPGRLRACANDECRLFLLDRSHAGTGRWCSMRTCGNRLKARRHQERQARMRD